MGGSGAVMQTSETVKSCVYIHTHTEIRMWPNDRKLRDAVQKLIATKPETLASRLAKLGDALNVSPNPPKSLVENVIGSLRWLQEDFKKGRHRLWLQEVCMPNESIQTAIRWLHQQTNTKLFTLHE